jgi:hypothetical protein
MRKGSHIWARGATPKSQNDNVTARPLPRRGLGTSGRGGAEARLRHYGRRTTLMVGPAVVGTPARHSRSAQTEPHSNRPHSRFTHCQLPARAAVESPPTPGRRADPLTVARTCVLIKTTSHLSCTCVLITCMSQASYGRWPFPDGSCQVRQNGSGHRRRAVPGPVPVSHRVARCVGPRGPLAQAAAAGRPHRSAGRSRQVRGAGVVTPGLSPPSSLLQPGEHGSAAGGRPRPNGPQRQSRPQRQSGRAEADGDARPRPASARAPC